MRVAGHGEPPLLPDDASAPSAPDEEARVSRLAASWIDNAAAWTEAVQSGAIASRRLGTDAAMLRAVARLPIGRVLDVGCGEGWLSRALAQQGHHVVGIDASAPLIAAARRLSQDIEAASRLQFDVASYVELPDRGEALGGPFSAAVCNFALLDANVEAALSAVHAVLEPGGTLLVQTVHPISAIGDGEYTDGWREETFATFATVFPSSMPWYFRTLGSWVTSVLAAGFVLRALEEPVAAGQSTPLSLLITATRA